MNVLSEDTFSQIYQLYGSYIKQDKCLLSWCGCLTTFNIAILFVSYLSMYDIWPV